MTKVFLTTLLLAVSQLVFAQNAYRVKATVPPSLNGSKVYLNISDYFSDARFQKKDSVIVRNGTFSFSGKIPKPAEFGELRWKNGWLSFIVDSGITEIIVEEQKEKLNELYRSKVINSKNNDIYAKLKGLDIEYKKKLKPRTYLLAQEQRELYQAHLNILKQYPNSAVSLIQTYMIASLGPMQRSLAAAMETYRTLAPDLRESPLGKEFYTKISKRHQAYNSRKVGLQMPEFEVNTFQSTVFNNKQLTGKPYIVAFSATWCVPCQHELPVLKSLYEKYKHTGLEVVYFNFDDDEKKWAEHINKYKLDWINVSEKTKMRDSKIAENFHVYVIPSALLVDKTGRILFNTEEEPGRLGSMEEELKKL